MHWNNKAYYYHPRFPKAIVPEELVGMKMREKITKLNVAVKREDMEDIAVLLASGIDPNKKGNDGRTCIMSAAFKWRPEILPLLLTLDGVDLNRQDKLGHTALSLAASSNNAEGVRMLVESYHGLDVNLPDRKGTTPLHLAVSKSELGVVKMLLDAGAAPNQTDKDGVSPMLLSSRTNSVDIFEALIAANGDVNSVDSRGRTPAIWCCRQGAADKLDVLIKQGADLTPVDYIDGMSAFAQAVWKDQTKCAIMILESSDCPNLLRSRKPELATGIVRTYWEVARSRKNIQMQNSLHEHMKNQIVACLTNMRHKLKLSVDLLEIIAGFSI